MDIWDLKHHFELALGLASPDARVRAAGDSGAWEAVAPDGALVAWAGRLEADAPPWAAPLFGFEVRVAEEGFAERGPLRYTPLALTPPVERDLALVMPAGVTARQVEEVLRRAIGGLLERLSVFDEYRGPAIPAGMRSVAWHCTFRDPVRTLRERDVDQAEARGLAALEGELGVRRREG